VPPCADESHFVASWDEWLYWDWTRKVAGRPYSLMPGSPPNRRVSAKLFSRKCSNSKRQLAAPERALDKILSM
jgi:hypothetical protein